MNEFPSFLLCMSGTPACDCGIHFVRCLRSSYRKDTPMPNCTPFLPPSPLLATSGTPAFSSALNGPCVYTKPNPAETEGSMSSRRFFLYARFESEDALAIKGCFWFSWQSCPAFRKPCSFIGHCSRFGMGAMRLRPALQKASPPNESTAKGKAQVSGLRRVRRKEN
jgi:hypothetical protein